MTENYTNWNEFDGLRWRSDWSSFWDLLYPGGTQQGKLNLTSPEFRNYIFSTLNAVMLQGRSLPRIKQNSWI